jgi:hypothetical protein
MQKLFKFADLYVIATSAETIRWAADIVNKAFEQVMGRLPTAAERQIVMATADLESNFGRGWGGNLKTHWSEKANQSASGKGSHNWGAIISTTKSDKGFQHGDSSVQGKYVTKFKSYPDDVSGAADLVRTLFKNGRKQREPDPNNGFRAMGPEISGPNRGEIISYAAKQGDTNLFSRAMWYTTYFEGTAKNFTDRMKSHMEGIQNKVNDIASALGESPEWAIKTSDYVPITNDTDVLERINSYGVGNAAKPKVQSPIENVRPKEKEQSDFGIYSQPNETQEMAPDLSALERMLWF